MVRVTETVSTYREEAEDHETVVNKLKMNGWQVEKWADQYVGGTTILSHPQMPGHFRYVSQDQ